MAIPTFVAKGTSGVGAGAVTCTMPAGVQAGDLLLLAICGEANGVADDPPTGGEWTLVGFAASEGGSSSATLTIYWAPYDAGINLTVPDAGNHTLAAVSAWRGVDIADPFDIVVTSDTGAAAGDTSITIDGGTTTVHDTLVLSFSAAGDNGAMSSPVNANLASPGITQAYSTSTTTGSNSRHTCWYGGLATAGETGDTTATIANNEREANIMIALQEEDAAGPSSGSALWNSGLGWPGIILETGV